MQMDMLLIMILCVIIILGIIFWQIKKRNLIKTRYSEQKNYNKAISKIKKSCTFKGHKLVQDIKITVNGEETKVDGIIIGKTGITVLEVRGYGGDIYTNPSEKRWVQVKDDKRKTFDNLLTVSKKHVELVRRVLAKSEVYRVEISNLVVFGGKSQVYAPAGFPICNLKNFKVKLKDIYKLSNNFIDMKKIEEVLNNPPKL